MPEVSGQYFSFNRGQRPDATMNGSPRQHSLAPSTQRRKRTYAEMENGGSTLPLFSPQNMDCLPVSHSPISAASAPYHGQHVSSITPPHVQRASTIMTPSKHTQHSTPSKKRAKGDPLTEAVTTFLKQKRFATVSELIEELKNLDLMVDFQKIQELGSKNKSFDLVHLDTLSIPTYIFMRDDDDCENDYFSSGTEDDTQCELKKRRHSEMWDFPFFNPHSSNRRDNVLFDKRTLFDQHHDNNQMRDDQ